MNTEMTQEEAAARIWPLIVERDMDGYALSSKSHLALRDIELGVRYLLSKEALNVKGDTAGPGLLGAWFQARRTPAPMNFRF